ncbi:MAG: hypothetical protein B7Z47_05095 [Chthoniobacter sp. 12-60-6]|nr:MAG: hypothetical protein B7Z47_05095 [Chthoniobacter sp. 12-60-6]
MHEHRQVALTVSLHQRIHGALHESRAPAPQKAEEDGGVSAHAKKSHVRVKGIAENALKRDRRNATLHHISSQRPQRHGDDIQLARRLLERTVERFERVAPFARPVAFRFRGPALLDVWRLTQFVRQDWHLPLSPGGRQGRERWWSARKRRWHWRRSRNDRSGLFQGLLGQHIRDIIPPLILFHERSALLQPLERIIIGHA